MERLTTNDAKKVCYDPWELCGMDEYCKKSAHEEGGCSKGCKIVKMYLKLANYEDLEEQGLLLRLPCKVGDTVWQASKFWKKIIPRNVALIVLSSENHIYIRNGCGDSFELGVDVFLTESEAEKALEEMGE